MEHRFRGALVAGGFITIAVLPSACGDDDAAGSGIVADGGGGGGGTANADGPISPEVAARFAILVGSCNPRTKAESVLRALYDNEGPSHLRGVAACTANKQNGCAALAECAGQTWVHNDAKCKPRCDGNVFESCDDGILAREDCSVRGHACVTDESGKLIHCSEPGASACDAGTGLGFATCGADGRAHECSTNNDHDVKGSVCADLGMTCGPGGCSGTGGSCTHSFVGQATLAFSGTSCDGPKVKTCVAGGFASLDCGRHITGATCHLENDGGTDGSAQCAIGDACELSTIGKRTCDGDSAVICNRGRIDRIDCRALGFTGCQVLPDDKDKVVCIPGVQ